MAKRKRGTTENLIERRIKEGRGTGRLSEYKPWLRIQDVASKGLSTRARGWKTGRVHHLLSLLELAYFYVLEWSLGVIDVREQFPLLPLEETLAIARSCGVRHPTDPRTKHPIVMTTDFVNTVRRGATDCDEPRTVKYKSDLLKQRTLEKLEIERRYWQARKITLKVVTEDGIHSTLAKNVEWLHSYRSLADFTDLDEFTFRQIASSVTEALKKHQGSLRSITLATDDRLGLEPGTSLSVVRHLLANRRLRVDMLKPINPGAPLMLLD
ncbi:MAG: TnsA endonuclease N-terminal domain-containing protein [Acidobacteriota bacterium]|nr:TnsA endonuclease N-terminal domain-containing protein [Acidobacteriota bacterium]MDQ5835199.1 TnsA endonuclease N-terminal domain-containing protein [Acidobacteriota bacterium]